MIDLFQHFDGGREGIKRRFMQKICDGLKEMQRAGLRTQQLVEYTGVNEDVINKIQQGDPDPINRDVVEALADPLGFTASDGLGPIKEVSREDAPALEKEMQEEGFVVIAGADGTHCSESQKRQLYIVVRALREL